MNVRTPQRIAPEFLQLKDELLIQEREEKDIVTVNDMHETEVSNVYLWLGDITRLGVDAIVNAANSQMLGCFQPCNACIDNCIHSAAGLQLREECYEIMSAQGYEEPTGQTKITSGYNLPAEFVLHTVGPIIYDAVTSEDEYLLSSCYRSCLKLAAKKA